MSFRAFFCLLLMVAPVALPAATGTQAPGLEAFRHSLTLGVLPTLEEPGFRDLVAARLAPDRDRTPLQPLVDEWARIRPSQAALAAWVRSRDLELRRRLGIEGTSPGVLELRVVWPQEDRRLDWDRVLFAIRPSPDAPAPETLAAYDLEGRLRRLDAKRPPEVPVLLLGADPREAVRAGLEVVNEGLKDAGWSPARVPLSPLSCMKLERFHIAAREKAWWWQDLEVYAIVSGIDPLLDKPALHLEQLPYAKARGPEYRPGQVLLFWSDYRYQAANIQFWCHGDGTDYRELLGILLRGVSLAMSLGGLQGFSFLPKLADAVVGAMPSSWWRGKDQLLDTFYAVEECHAYVDRWGASENVRATLVPWILRPR